MEFKKKIRCPYCDGKIRLDRRKDWLSRNPFDKNSIIIPRVDMPTCVSCSRKFVLGIKTEGELEFVLEEECR